jgi:hypothetical protein
MAHAQRAPFGHGIGFFIMSIAFNIGCLELASIDLLCTKFHDRFNYLVLAPVFRENTGLIFSHSDDLTPKQYDSTYPETRCSTQIHRIYRRPGPKWRQHTQSTENVRR